MRSFGWPAIQRPRCPEVPWKLCARKVYYHVDVDTQTHKHTALLPKPDHHLAHVHAHVVVMCACDRVNLDRIPEAPPVDPIVCTPRYPREGNNKSNRRIKLWPSSMQRLSHTIAIRVQRDGHE